METLHDFPYFRLEYDLNARPVSNDAAEKLVAFLKASPPTDVVFISHGWNNNMDEAQELYDAFFKRVRAHWNRGSVAGLESRRAVVAGVLWPSKRFTDSELIPGGAAGIKDEDDALKLVRAVLDRLAEDDPTKASLIAACKKDLDKLESDPKVQDAFVARVLQLLPATEADPEEGLQELRAVRGRELLDRLSPPVILPSAGDEEDGGGAAGVEDEDEGGAAGIGSFLGGIIGGAAKLLHFTTYYTMKERAGLVGMRAIHPLLVRIQTAFPALRIHLIGHSFGGRLVSAAARGADGSPRVQIASLTLLQAAFSHYGFSNNAAKRGKNGYFRAVTAGECLRGPALVTHTANDKAVGIAYALASRAAGENAAGIGDSSSDFGGIGRNGALLTPEAMEGKLLAAGSAYQWKAGKFHNLLADAFIKGHSDVTGPEVTWAWLTAFASA